MIKQFCIVTFFLFAITINASAAPKLSLSAETISFETIPFGEKRSAIVALQNTGDETFEITGIRSSCVCVSAKTDTKSIAPGESQKLIITFNSALKTPGLHTLRVFIRSNHPDQTLTVITVIAMITPPENTVSTPE